MISTSLNLCLRVHPIFHGGSKKAIIKETASATAAVTIKAIETGIILLSLYLKCWFFSNEKEVPDQTTATFLLQQAAVMNFLNPFCFALGLLPYLSTKLNEYS